jgi:hypothetical protein
VNKTALVSDAFEFHRLASYVARMTKKRVAFVIGAATLHEIFDERAATALEGGVMVPPEVANVIRAQNLFGWRERLAAAS